MEEEFKPAISFDLICPGCGVGNPRGAINCLVCDKNLEETIYFMEDDSFDLEITALCLRNTGRISGAPGELVKSII
jgi:hypothetical protein